MRFWQLDRWKEQEFIFDFTSKGDAVNGLSNSNEGVPTLCIPYHADYYRNSWHRDCPWSAEQAEVEVADLIHNILKRS